MMNLSDTLTALSNLYGDHFRVIIVTSGRAGYVARLEVNTEAFVGAVPDGIEIEKFEWAALLQSWCMSFSEGLSCLDSMLVDKTLLHTNLNHIRTSVINQGGV